MRLFWTLGLGWMVGMLAGCTVGPDYRAPDVALPDCWGESIEAAGSGMTLPSRDPNRPAGADLSSWWTGFNDKKLTALIGDAVTGNLDLQIVEERIRQARAMLGIVGADQFPAADVRGSFSRIESSGTTYEAQRGLIMAPHNLYQAGFDASWELDLFGGTRRRIEAARADLDSASEARRDVLVTLIAEVARNYIDLRSAQTRIEIANRNIESQSKALELTRSRFANGLTSRLDVTQAESLLSSTQAQIPLLETQALQSIHRLSVLLGKQPNALRSELMTSGPIPGLEGGLAKVPTGLPSDLLRRRPDIRRAERQLAAANARIGAATADLYPRFVLTGTGGFQSENSGNLLDNRSWFSSFGPGVQWPIFDAGRIRWNIEMQDSRTKEALAAYHRTILVSLEEAENALTTCNRQLVRRRSLAEAEKSGSDSVKLAGELYEKGLGSFLAVLDAQRSLYAQQDQLVQSDQAVIANLIALYKALGGGWQAYEPAGPNTPQPATAATSETAQ
jgi:NodT family efflux transporter outer membrane factor (OMF) lipoprotein